MRCPSCSETESKVLDSRATDESSSIRRRRECLNCKTRFTTYEKIESTPILVIKKDGTREPFNRTKVMNGIIRACEKRFVKSEDIEKLVDSVEFSIMSSLTKEVTSTKIGEYILQGLKDLDEVAYIRFASVYRSFKDINSFMDELNKLINEKAMV